MQRESTRRGFSISHQRVVLEIDFSGSIWGYTELTIVPTSKDLRTIHLHSRNCTIHKVLVANHHADFIHYDSLPNLTTNAPQDVHSHPELKRKLYSALADGDEGELSILIPREVPVHPLSNVTSGLVSEAATPEPQTPGFPVAQLAQVNEFAPIMVNIEYSLRGPVDGLNFVLPSDAYPHRVPHVYTTPSSPDAARCWVPCVDNMWERCTWDFEFIVPRYLEDRGEDRGSDDEDDEEQEEHPTVVVCSGELVEQVAHPFNSNKSIFVFSQSILTSAQHIGFAAGPFHVLSIPVENNSNDEAGSSSQPQMHAFCLPGHELSLAVSVAFTRQAMSFYSTEFGSYPFGSYKIIFVDELPVTRFDTSTLCLASVDLLHGDDAIDQVYETRQVLSHALACQWAGINILPKTWSDLWLVNGLGLYITALFLRKLFGNNEYRFRLKKDMERAVEWDNGSMPPICQPLVYDPPDASFLPFVNLKAPLVLHILDRRLGKSGTSLGLSRVLPKLFLSAISGEMPNNALSTHAFLRTCRKVSSVDLRSFADQWIYGSGCPSFGFTATFNRKKMAVEITMRQDAPAWKVHEHDEVRKTLLKPVSFFEGQMTIRIHEADGTPYEHVLDIRAPFKRYEVPFNTKYKRVRRNTKRYLARQAAAQAAAEGDAEAAEAMGMVDMGFGLEVWEKEKERENWKVADWTEEDEQMMSGATYEWIRMDADFEWIAAIAFDQPDFMWVSQLQRDRDVVAQLEAVNALVKMPSAIVSSTLTKSVLVTNYFFRIRCEAALALVTCALRKMDFLGLFHLFKLFLRYCYDPEDPQQDLFTHTYVPRPNDFSDISEYFVRRALVKAISQVRFENGRCPTVVRQFLIDQLKYNDNTANGYTDAFYICTTISSLACASMSTAPPERGELLATHAPNEQSTEEAMLVQQALTEVDRYRNMDRLIPSPHNVVTVAALEFRLILSVANLITNDPRVFFPLTREGNFTQVRIAAFDALFLTKWYTPKIMRYIFAVMANDQSRVIRRHVARSACQALALLVTMGELKNGTKDSESVLIEEDGNAPEKTRESKKSEVDVLIKTLRKDKEVGKNEIVREFLLPIALAPDADQEVRWAVLKLADLVIRGQEEIAPKLSIHLPPQTPIVEFPPPLPLKVPAKQRTIKAGIQPLRSPVTPSLVPAKIRLPPSTPVDVPSPKLPPVSVKPPPPPVPAAQKKGVAFDSKPKGKLKVSKAVPKAQSGGMTTVDVKASRNVIQKLKAHKCAKLFLQPVDPVRDHAPDYFEVIKNPMDLSTMSAKLDAGMYTDRFAFEADFRLMIRNAKTYNAPTTFVFTQAVALETFFDNQWTRMTKTIEASREASKPAARSMAPPPVPIPVPPTARISNPIPPAPMVSSSEAAPKPSIRFKLGGNTSSRLGESSRTKSATPIETPIPPAVPGLKQPKPRKQKTVDARPAPPPPPVADVDDGSFDLLEEVIAIEEQQKREKGLERKVQPSIRMDKVEKEKPKAGPSAPGKRKKEFPVLGLIEDDEILALASPSKKRSRSPHTSERRESRPPKPAIKIKKVEAPASVSLPEFKGKGREHVVTPVPLPAPTPAPVPVPKVLKSSSSLQSSTPINKTRCKEILRGLLKIPEAGIFSRPVDPVLDGCPTYYDEIKHPMDLGTISSKLNVGDYTSMEHFQKDFDLVLSNCRLFNPPTTYPTQCADVVERAFKKEWSKLMERKLSWGEKRSLQSLMAGVMKENISFYFREPVDPVLLGIPQYFDIIPRKDARDLRTIKQKLDADKYDSVAGWEADIDLMVRNAVHFNGADSEVGVSAVALGARIQELLASLGNKKRKESERPNGAAPSKKVRLG
ncbi:hypothetical protein OF83DRAFT_1234654 [Amylostereum chailletii]|nr:hypothetical protein OF83DRAFT_1234654 [Amylostereum chailletii]